MQRFRSVKFLFKIKTHVDRCVIYFGVFVCYKQSVFSIYIDIKFIYLPKGVFRIVKWENRVFACLSTWPQDSLFEVVVDIEKSFSRPNERHFIICLVVVVPKRSRKLARMLWWIKSFRVKKMYFVRNMNVNFKPSHVLLHCIKWSDKCSRIRISGKLN